MLPVVLCPTGDEEGSVSKTASSEIPHDLNHHTVTAFAILLIRPGSTLLLRLLI